MVATSSFIDEPLASLLQLLDELIADPGAPIHEHDKVEADIKLLRTQTEARADFDQVKAVLSRLQKWSATAVFTGASARVADNVHELIGQII